MYHAFQAILDAKLTDNYLLFSFLYFLRQEDEGAADLDIDVPIKDLFLIPWAILNLASLLHCLSYTTQSIFRILSVTGSEYS